jgi:plasminogen activator inhibitor 1 RNA-binding protein
MTLDEYKKNHPSPKQNLPPPRQPNDGKEDPKWKDGVVVHRPDDEDYYAGKVRKRIIGQLVM